MALSVYGDDMPILDKGLVFIKEEEILLTGDNWILTTDIKISECRVVLDAFERTLNDIIKIDEQLGTNMELRQKEKISTMVSKEVNFIKNDVSKLKLKIDDLVKTVAPYGLERTKRGLINAGGSVLKFLFGTADNNDLEGINKKIDTLSTKTDGILNLMDEQVTVIKNVQENNKRLNSNFEKFKTVVSRLNEKIDMISVAEGTTIYQLHGKIIQSLNLDSALRTTEYVLNDLKETVSDFSNALEATAMQKLSPVFINPSLLSQALRLVQNNLPAGLALLTSDFEKNTYIYYDLAVVRAAYFNETLRIFAQIPLKASGRYFKVFRALPLPYNSGTEDTKLYIDDNLPYLAVSEDGQYYIEMDTPDMLVCKRGFMTICPPSKPVRRMSDTCCLTALYTGHSEQVSKLCSHKVTRDNRSVLFRAKNTNLWVYSVEKDILTFNCPSTINPQQFNTTTKIIKGTGIINIPASCIVHNKNYFLLPHSLTTSKVESLYYNIIIPPVDTNITHFTNFSSQSGTKEEIREIINSIDTKHLKNGIDLNVWRQHIERVRSYKIQKQSNFGFGTVIAIIIIIAMIIVGCKCKNFVCKKLLNRGQPARSQTEEIEMPIYIPPTISVTNAHPIVKPVRETQITEDKRERIPVF